MSTAVKESYFWTQVKAGLGDDETQLCRIENTAGTGIFDVNGCRAGREVWIELKVFHGNRVHFRNSQRIWGLRRASVGGNLYVLIRHDNGLGGAVMLLYSAMAVFNVAYKSEPGGKSFSILSNDMPEPLYRCSKPFRWDGLRTQIFETGL